MGLISKILEKLFGKGQPGTQNTGYHLGRWEKERLKRIKEAEEQLKPWIISIVKEKGGLAFSWESGNDEAFVTLEGITGADDNTLDNMEGYIIDKLNIPDAGEFNMNGSGNIYIDNNAVKVKYSSTMREIIDYNEETDETVYGEGEDESADEVLFTI